MSNLREAAQQALEALHVVLKDDYSLPYEKIVAATDALRAALAEPVQEPVATLWQHCETGRTRVTMPDQVFTQDATWDIVGPLYLHPTQGAANSQAILDGSSAEPVATLHDDGCFTWKRDEFRLKYDRQRAGWRIDVYTRPAQALPARLVLFTLRDLKAERKRLDGFLALGNEVGRAAEYDEWIAALETYAAAHGITPKENGHE